MRVICLHAHVVLREKFRASSIGRFSALPSEIDALV
jgi:hypothetical protein